jgi:serine/threonine protein phosphatase PrpC
VRVAIGELFNIVDELFHVHAREAGITRTHGSTASVVILVPLVESPGQARVVRATVGDSPIIMLHGAAGKPATQISIDDNSTNAGEKTRLLALDDPELELGSGGSITHGEMTSEVTRSFEFGAWPRGIIVSVPRVEFGTELESTADGETTMRSGDTIVVCSDGVYPAGPPLDGFARMMGQTPKSAVPLTKFDEMRREDDWSTALRDELGGGAAKLLVDAAAAGESSDNMTAVVVLMT